MTQAGQEPTQASAATDAAAPPTSHPAGRASANPATHAPHAPRRAARRASRAEGDKEAKARLREQADLPVAVGLLLVAAVAAMALPAGDVARAAITLPILLVVPGYLLVQAVMLPARPLRSRGLDALLGLGISPPLVGVLAFSTSFVEGGFKPGTIVAVVTVAGVLLAAFAAWRRLRAAPAAPAPPVAA